MEIDNRPKKGMWAPGDYVGKCCNCGETYIGDKRSSICAPCAYEDNSPMCEDTGEAHGPCEKCNNVNPTHGDICPFCKTKNVRCKVTTCFGHGHYEEVRSSDCYIREITYLKESLKSIKYYITEIQSNDCVDAIQMWARLDYLLGRIEE